MAGDRERRRACAIAAAIAAVLLAQIRAHAQTVIVMPESTAAAIAPDSVLRSGWSGPSDSALVTVLLVRHAEKNTAMLGHDVPLSDGGRRRAQTLARVAAEAGVSTIYVTPTLRAKQTAVPLAQLLGDTLTVIDSIDATVARLRTRHWGKTVLVVGHSDTVPQIIRALTGRKAPVFGPEFDVLYVVTLTRDGRSSVTRLRYGEP